MQEDIEDQGTIDREIPADITWVWHIPCSVSVKSLVPFLSDT
jgi:hypothetical protein